MKGMFIFIVMWLIIVVWFGNWMLFVLWWFGFILLFWFGCIVGVEVFGLMMNVFLILILIFFGWVIVLLILLVEVIVWGCVWGIFLVIVLFEGCCWCWEVGWLVVMEELMVGVILEGYGLFGWFGVGYLLERDYISCEGGR